MLCEIVAILSFHRHFYPDKEHWVRRLNIALMEDALGGLFGVVLFYQVRNRITEVLYSVCAFASTPNAQLLVGSTSTEHL